MALGNGLLFLRHVWASVVGDAVQLARLGVKTTADSIPQDFSDEWDDILEMTQPGVAAESLPDRIMLFLQNCSLVQISCNTATRAGFEANFRARFTPASAISHECFCVSSYCIACTCI